jgi:hypothetical protein
MANEVPVDGKTRYGRISMCRIDFGEDEKFNGQPSANDSWRGPFRI